MKTRSCKAKGRRLQDYVKAAFINSGSYEKVRTAIMGEAGPDVYVDDYAIKLAIECKNQQGLSKIYNWFEQAERNAIWAKEKDPHPNTIVKPILVIKQNHCKPLAIVDFTYFIQMLGGSEEVV